MRTVAVASNSSLEATAKGTGVMDSQASVSGPGSGESEPEPGPDPDSDPDHDPGLTSGPGPGSGEVVVDLDLGLSSEVTEVDATEDDCKAAAEGRADGAETTNVGKMAAKRNTCPSKRSSASVLSNMKGGTTQEPTQGPAASSSGQVLVKKRSTISVFGSTAAL